MLNNIKQRLLADPHGPVSLSLRLIGDYGRQHWRGYALALFWMASVAACTAASAYIIGTAINEAYVNRSFSGVASVAIAIIIIFTIKGISTYGQAVVLAKISNQIDAENQRRMFDKLLQQDLSYFSDRHSSEFTARVAYGSGAAGEALRILITTLGRDALTLGGLLSVMVHQAPLLSLVGVLLMGPSVTIVRHLVKRVRNIAQSEFAGTAQLAESMQETIQGLRVVKALNLENEMSRRFGEATVSVERAGNKLARVMNRSTPMMDTLGGCVIGLMLLYGGYEVVELGQPPGQFITFVAAFLLAYEPGKRLARLNVDLGSALVGVEMLYKILDLPNRARDDQRPDLKVGQGKILFRDVKFAYRKLIKVLVDLSFAAEPGKITALVGPSGGGKTTIFNLLLRFYDPDEGEVTIDGQNIAALSQASVRGNIAYVGQDIFLFRGTVRENIAVGRLGASDEEVITAATAAYAHDFIMALSAGYETPVGEHGMQLSGGQRQRIAVARAMIRNVPIILLDEPTASLDGESEIHVQNAIRRLAEGRTTLVIAHRLNTIKDADMIHVVEEGRIVESGQHESLLRAGARYADFYYSQFGNDATAKPAEPRLSANL
ncbi:MAG: ATP-binding cassette, subfamily bacterial [Bradyrhizobium sp.]